MKAVFFGTPDWAVPSLEALLGSDLDVAAVVTNPDRPAGRGYELKPPPVKICAEGHGVLVEQPVKARDPGFIGWLREIAPDVCVVVAYGKILPKELLDLPQLGFVNLHFSLLPAYRGAAPVQRAVMDGLAETGISIMLLTEGMDEGPVLDVLKVTIEPDETAGELGTRLAELGAPFLVDTVARYAAGELTPEPQDDSAATYAPKIGDDEARIAWTSPADTIRNLVRGLNPMPGAWTTFRGARLKVHRVDLVPGSGEPGRIVDPDLLVVGTGEGALRLVEIQAAGKRKMLGEEAARGLRPSPDELFE